MQISVDWTLILAVISALTALVSTIVGPLVAFMIATRSANLAAHVAERKEWVQQFREDVANYLTTAIRVRGYEETQALGLLEGDLLGSAVANMMAFTSLFYKIVLRLDITNTSHLEILNSLHSLDAASRERPPATSDTDLRNLRQVVVNQCRELIMIELDEISGKESSRTIGRVRKRELGEPEKVLVKECLFDEGVEESAKK